MENICPNTLLHKEVKTKRSFGQDISNKPDLKKLPKDLIMTKLQGGGNYMEKNKSTHINLDQ